jgi:hypothetical protein
MELDNIIYVVLIVVLFVVSLIGNPLRKKKITVPLSVEKETNYSLNDFEKILERKQEYICEQPIETDEISIAETQDISGEPAVQEKSSKKESKKEDTEVNDGFDVNSAIVYSSILERKKFRH